MTTGALERRELLDLMRTASEELYAAGWLTDLAAVLLRDDPLTWLPRYLAAGGAWVYPTEKGPGTTPTPEELASAEADDEPDPFAWYRSVLWVPTEVAFGASFADLAASDAPLEWVLRRLPEDAFDEDLLLAAAERAASAPELLLLLAPLTPDLEPSDDPRENALLELLTRFVLDGHPSDDREDVVEQAARVEAALAAFGEDRTWVSTDGNLARRASDGTERPASELAHLPRVGSVLRFSALSETRQSVLAGDYSYYEAFARNAGREVAVVGLEEGAAKGETSAALALLALRERGHDRAIVKWRRAEKSYPLFRLDLPEGASATELGRLLDDEMGWAAVHAEGRARALLVQEVVVMRSEYRVFVVDHEPVTGAGCLETHTPLESSGEAFDDAVEDVRGEGPERRDPAVRDELVAFARTVAAELAEEVPELRDYVVDVALGPRGPLVVELNPLQNSGLYGSTPRLVTEALRAEYAGRAGAARESQWGRGSRR